MKACLLERDSPGLTDNSWHRAAMDGSVGQVRLRSLGFLNCAMRKLIPDYTQAHIHKHRHIQKHT